MYVPNNREQVTTLYRTMLISKLKAAMLKSGDVAMVRTAPPIVEFIPKQLKESEIGIAILWNTHIEEHIVLDTEYQV